MDKNCTERFGSDNRKCLRCTHHSSCAERHELTPNGDGGYDHDDLGPFAHVSSEDWAAAFGVTVEEMLQSPADR
jgi:hypothetical protein